MCFPTNAGMQQATTPFWSCSLEQARTLSLLFMSLIEYLTLSSRCHVPDCWVPIISITFPFCTPNIASPHLRHSKICLVFLETMLVIRLWNQNFQFEHFVLFLLEAFSTTLLIPFKIIILFCIHKIIWVLLRISIFPERIMLLKNMNLLESSKGSLKMNGWIQWEGFSSQALLLNCSTFGVHCSKGHR